MYLKKNRALVFKNHAAFTLTEVLVVLIIIGILVLLALPSLMPLISKAKSTEAKLQLEHVYTLERSYFFENSVYTNDLNAISFEQQQLTTNGGQANYKIEIMDASPKGFKARATAVVDFDGDGTFNQWEIDHNKKLVETVPD
ncbi:prepilin-type N-terminal cleavage/methylation domain-containing protein [Niabella hirudinis]|uniref:prepilin-type N-terminal cleavage/methylation domain-containing protein n=1 Tax=Niabella hirudinis TaxID=1285929 RepID=UPI003EB760E9